MCKAQESKVKGIKWSMSIIQGSTDSYNDSNYLLHSFSHFFRLLATLFFSQGFYVGNIYYLASKVTCDTLPRENCNKPPKKL